MYFLVVVASRRTSPSDSSRAPPSPAFGPSRHRHLSLSMVGQQSFGVGSHFFDYLDRGSAVPALQATYSQEVPSLVNASRPWLSHA